GGESAIAPLVLPSIHKQEVLSRVVGHEQIHQPIVVHIGRDDAECFTQYVFDIRSPSGLGEGSVAVVAPQDAGRRVEEVRNAVVIVKTAVFILVGAQQTICQVIPDVAADKKIEKTVVVIVEPDGACGPPGRCHAGLVCDISERAVSIVVIQDAASVCRDEQVRIAVVVVVAGRDAHAECSAAHAGFVRDIGEGAIPVVLVEGILERPRGLIEIAGSAVPQVDVHPAVVVVVEKRAAWAERLGQESLRRSGVFVSPANTARRCRDFFEERGGRGGVGWGGGKGREGRGGGGGGDTEGGVG